MNDNFTGADVIDIGELDVSEAREPSVLQDGQYQLRILNADIRQKIKDDGTTVQWVSVRTEAVDGGDNAMDIYHTLFLPPKSGEEGTRTAKQINRTKFEIKKFCSTFQVPLTISTSAVDGWTGALGWAEVKTEKDLKGSDRNSIRTLVAPR